MCPGADGAPVSVSGSDGKDPILKERLFGLTTSEGNHGEDVKEYYNRSPEAALLHLLPALWFRNTWSWPDGGSKPILQAVEGSARSVIHAHHTDPYQLTVIGAFAQAMVAEKINGNRFTVRTSTPDVEVSWQVTGIRRDPWAERHRIAVEQEKPERERGQYLYPELSDQPEEKNVERTRHSELMRQMQEEGHEQIERRGQ
jgi:hypothetical protein